MSYKYYSIMRPIGLGTIPNEKVVKIVNYPEGRKQIIATDGRKLMAWGEVEFEFPLTRAQMDAFELKGETEYSTFRHIGYWKNDPNGYEIISIDGTFYALGGWNGEAYERCWECVSKTCAWSDNEYTLKPIYRYETKEGRAEMDKMTDLDEDS